MPSSQSYACHKGGTAIDNSETVVDTIIKSFPVKTALATGEGSQSIRKALAARGVDVMGGLTEDTIDYRNARIDLFVLMGLCDKLSPEVVDEYIPSLTKFASLILFQSGVPGKNRPAEIPRQVEDYWISLFEINGNVAVKAFGEGGRMPILFCSKGTLESNPELQKLAENVDFDWRTSFQTGARDARSTEPTKQVGPDTSGQTRKIAASVVAFQPKKDQLENVRHLASIFDCVVVADNSEPPIEPLPGVEWVSMNGNKGIAAALNAACERAKDLGYEWLLTLDQDTAIDPNALERYMNEFIQYDDKDGTAIVAPRTDGRDAASVGTGDAPSAVRELEMVMTSGCLTNLDIWEKIGGFSDELFIDEVDHDYCLNARKSGFRVVRLLNAYLPHQPGRLMTIVTLRVHPTLVGWHPPKRLYYIVRNYFFMKRRYKDAFPAVIAERRRLVIAKFKEYLLYHPNRLPTVYAMIKGAFHGMIGRFGR